MTIASLRLIAVAAALALIAWILSACTLEQQAIVDAAIARKQAYSDTEAKALSHAPCAITIGAYWRNFTADERDALATLCGGDPAVTVDELVRADRLLRALDFREQ